MTTDNRGRGGARAVLVLLNILGCSLSGCIEDFPAYVGVQSGADIGQGGAGGGDGPLPDSTNPRDGGTDSVATDMAAPDARQGDGGRTDADVGTEGDRGVNCTFYRPEGEICDGNDNDCDGNPDEGIPHDNCCGECGDPRETCNTQEQRQQCNVDAGVQVDHGVPADDAEVLPPADLGMEDQGDNCVPEVCDNQDNDCDGDTDEGLLNACERCGELPLEVCDRVDNDCDGRIDEGINCDCVEGRTQPCYTGANGTADIGACRMGQQTCNAQGNWAACEGEILPQAEICDNIDNDCDGRTDEFAGPRGCSVGVGACTRGGQRVCAPLRGEIVCDGQPGAPSPELCDGTDNNCDGRTDEDFNLGDACTEGVGACARNGQQVCNGVEAQCNADPGVPRAEVCDNQDNDCDGNTDEDLNLDGDCQVGVGICARPGRLACAQGEDLPVCAGNPGAPGAETCDNIDNDCDGNVDEDFNVGMPCFGNDMCRSQGVIRCAAGGDSQCIVDNVVPPAPERCDGDDDDCDGRTDEDFNLAEPCSVGVGACLREAVAACTGDQESTTCGALPGDRNPELCNNIDDDCNGEIDDVPGLNEPCTVGVGACATEGVLVCGDQDDPICDAEPGAPSPELCDDIDNDCDGNTDEGLGLGERCNAGVGACARSGMVVCDLNGATTCNAIPGFPSQERCFGDDADCDGIVEEGLLCPDLVQVPEGDVIDLGGRRVPLPAFRISVYETTSEQQQNCFEHNPQVCTRARMGVGYTYGVAEKSDHPVNGVTWQQARAYCQALGGDLPTAEQWLRACRGDTADPYCYQVGDFPTCDQAQLLGCEPNGTAPVGSHPAGVSVFGLYDMHGNVIEWTLGPDGRPNYWLTFGAAWENGPNEIYVRADRPFGAPANAVGVSYGFRCAFPAQ